MNKQELQKLIDQDELGLLNIDYEICSLRNGKEKIKAISLTEAKKIATKKGYGKFERVCIRGFKGNFVASKKPGEKWIDSNPYIKDIDNLEFIKN